ncbi:MAG: cytochrome c [Deltaproteobacteria bacterium]|nr:cytochrome c [Deltaproteobacteria bacterium]MBW2394544.1 cytochrome c [Deltaproteobacteria bacterium]
MRSFASIVVVLLLLCSGIGLALEESPVVQLSFVRDGAVVSTQTLGQLRAACAERTLEIGKDPYYGVTKRFRVCPLREVLAQGFGDDAALAGESLLLRALDGYTRQAEADQLLGPGAYLAFADADRLARGEQGFDPIDRRQVDPAPFYLVWERPEQWDAHAWPWPYQLATVEIASFEERHPHTVPTGAETGSPTARGYGLFQRECAHCHAINGEGGKVGPELNVPRNITEYRPEAQLREFIRNPESFRYTSMPAHQHLTELDLDALLSYLARMAELKHDPGPLEGDS